MSHTKKRYRSEEISPVHVWAHPYPLDVITPFSPWRPTMNAIWCSSSPSQCPLCPIDSQLLGWPPYILRRTTVSTSNKKGTATSQSPIKLLTTIFDMVPSVKSKKVPPAQHGCLPMLTFYTTSIIQKQCQWLFLKAGFYNLSGIARSCDTNSPPGRSLPRSVSSPVSSATPFVSPPIQTHNSQTTFQLAKEIIVVVVMVMNMVMVEESNIW